MKLVKYTTDIKEIQSPYARFTGQCPVCGKHIDKPVWSGNHRGLCVGCFSKAFYEEWLLDSQENPGRCFITNGHLYTVGNETRQHGLSRGMGGRKFFIRFYDDPNTIVETTNLWSQGGVPADDPRFGDNAEFLTVEKVQELCDGKP